jgi:hypothetical protein
MKIGRHRLKRRKPMLRLLLCVFCECLQPQFSDTFNILTFCFLFFVFEICNLKLIFYFFKLRGVKSSAVEREDWADDFDFAPQEKSKLKHKLRLPPAVRDTPSRRRPTSGVSSALHNSGGGPGGGGSGKKKQLVFSSSPSTSSVFTQMPNVVAPALRLLPMLPVDTGEPSPPCSGSHAHLDRASELRAWSVERRQKALRAEHKRADELKASAKPDARSLCVSLVTQGLLLMADDHIAKAVKCFDRAYSVVSGGRRGRDDCRPRAALH